MHVAGRLQEVHSRCVVIFVNQHLSAINPRSEDACRAEFDRPISSSFWMWGSMWGEAVKQSRNPHEC